MLMRFAAAAVMALAVSGLSLDDASAQSRSYRDAGPGYVTAESQYGHGTITAPVRRGRVEWEVRMPRGTWIGCGRSCAQTLRQQTVDYWESNGRDAPSSGPNYFRWSFGW
jgi:hypothetical protein